MGLIEEEAHAAAASLQLVMKYCIKVPRWHKANIGITRTRWLDNNIGVNCIDWLFGHIHTDPLQEYVVYHFKREEDALLFALKWA
jgi:hypothetical protein